jgi:hypothetical protein
MVFTYATEMKDTLRVLLESLKGHNYSYRVLGYGETWRGFRNRVNTYLSGVSKYKEERGDDALVVMVDGYDCLCIKDSEKLYKSFINKENEEDNLEENLIIKNFKTFQNDYSVEEDRRSRFSNTSRKIMSNNRDRIFQRWHFLNLLK